MIDSKRRRYLIGSLLSSAAIGLACKAPSIAFADDELDAGLLRELNAVLDHWFSLGLGSPVQYLDGLEYEMTHTDALIQKIAADFDDENLFVVNGLVLSFTEAIIMSNLGMIALNRK